MNFIYDYLQKLGYTINSDYYNNIQSWIDIWSGNANWLDVTTTDNKKYPMYSLGIAKRSCEDLASTITSEPFTIKAKSNDKQLQNDLDETEIMDNMAEAIEIMGYTGTVALVARIENVELVGEGDTATIRKGKNTKKKIEIINGSQIIPLTIVNNKIQNVAFVSNEVIKINNKNVKVLYMELHELKEKGYQVSNVYFRADNGKEIDVDGVLGTYNTLSKQPLFAIGKLPRLNPIANNMGLGISLFGDSIDQLKILDLTYNNFGQDFRLGQKLLIVNKRLTNVETIPYTDKDGNIKQKKVIVYPTDIQKQLFTDMSDGIMGSPNDKPYVYEYNPDLRVGDNKEGVQFALDNYSFKVGFGTHYYSFENGVLKTATEAIISRKDFVDNGNKIRRAVNKMVKNMCRALLLCDKILGMNIDETQKIEIANVDGFLLDEESQRDKLFSDYGAGLITHKRFLMKVYNMTEEEAQKEIEDIKKENSVDDITPTEDEIEEE